MGSNGSTDWSALVKGTEKEEEATVTAMNITTRERSAPITFFFSRDEVFFTPSTLSTMAFIEM